MDKNRFSKDPKVRLVTLQEFFEWNDFLRGVKKKDLWSSDTIPSGGSSYFKITPNLMIYVYYGYTLTNFGFDLGDKLQEIQVAFRDGVTEYKIIEDEIKRLNEEKIKHKYSKIIPEQLALMPKVMKLLPKYEAPCKPIKKKFEDYLVDTGKKFKVEGYKKKIIIFDTETNGTRKSNDDLLSLSIYDPSTGICYNRFFPLDLQPLILTSFIHGITDDDIKFASHWDQEEVNKIIDFFDLKNAFVLSYSGGQGTFDSTFVNNYCKRHKLTGFEDLDYRNIKSLIPAAPFGSEGQLTKDNLCRILKIEGVQEYHSSMNDCILEWQLFEKLLHGKLFFIQEHIFAYHSDYIIPVSYLNMHKELVKYAQIELKPLTGFVDKIYEFNFPDKVLKQIKKFPTNITGITIENALNHLLDVKQQDNFQFLAENKKHLEYIGSLDSRIEKIPVITEDDGTVKTTDSRYEEYIEEVNGITKIISDNLTDVVNFIKKEIFTGKEIMSQELVISDDKKILALCDLSDSKNVLEIKTYGVLTDDGYLSPKVARQLYYQSNKRNNFVLSIQFDTHYEVKTFEEVVDDVHVFIYSIDLKEEEMPPYTKEWSYMDTEIDTFNLIRENPCISKSEISRRIGYSIKAVDRHIKVLVDTGVIEKSSDSKNSPWIVKKEIKIGDTYKITYRRS